MKHLSSLFTGFLLVGCSFLPIRALASTTDGTIDSSSHYAWSENIGWIDFGTSQGSVHVADTGLSGYAWNETTGWISLNCSNTNTCGTVNYRVANDGAGTLSGYAWSENAGWIQFAPTGGGVRIDSNGVFSGEAWGENIGWIVFNCATTGTCGTVSYKVQTDWRPFLTRTSSVSLASSVNPSTVSGPVTFTAVLTPTTASGTLAFQDGGILIGTATAGHGSGSYTTSGLAAGIHGITVVYSGTYQVSTSALLAQTVSPGSAAVVTPSGGGGGGSRRTSPVTVSSALSTHTSSAPSSANSVSASSLPLGHTAAPLPSSSASSAIPAAALVSLAVRSNLRSSPAASASHIASLQPGWQVTVESTQGSWTKVKTASGKEGYVLTKNLQMPILPPLPSALPPSYPVVAGQTRTTTTSLKLHLSPNVASRNLTTFNPNTTVELLSIQGDWAEVQAGSHTGWVVRRFLRK